MGCCPKVNSSDIKSWFTPRTEWARLVEYTSYRFWWFTFNWQIVAIIRFILCALCVCTTIGGMYYDITDITYLGYLKYWSIILTTFLFGFLLLICYLHRSSKYYKQPFKATFLLKLVEWLQLIVVAMNVVVMIGWSVADPGLWIFLGVKDSQEESERYIVTTLEGWERIVNDVHVYAVPCFVMCEFALNRVPHNWKAYAIAIAVFACYCFVSLWVNDEADTPIYHDPRDYDYTLLMACLIAVCAGQSIMRYFQSPVYDADKEAEKKAKGKVKEHFSTFHRYHTFTDMVHDCLRVLVLYIIGIFTTIAAFYIVDDSLKNYDNILYAYPSTERSGHTEQERLEFLLTVRNTHIADQDWLDGFPFAALFFMLMMYVALDHCNANVLFKFSIHEPAAGIWLSQKTRAMIYWAIVVIWSVALHTSMQMNETLNGISFSQQGFEEATPTQQFLIAGVILIFATVVIPGSYIALKAVWKRGWWAVFMIGVTIVATSTVLGTLEDEDKDHLHHWCWGYLVCVVLGPLHTSLRKTARGDDKKFKLFTLLVEVLRTISIAVSMHGTWVWGFGGKSNVAIVTTVICGILIWRLIERLLFPNDEAGNSRDYKNDKTAAESSEESKPERKQEQRQQERKPANHARRQTQNQQQQQRPQYPPQQAQPQYYPQHYPQQHPQQHYPQQHHPGYAHNDAAVYGTHVNYV